MSPRATEGACFFHAYSHTMFCRIRVVVAEMIIEEGKLTWGQLINTTGNRVRWPSGQYNRDDGPLAAMKVEDIFELEKAASRAQDVCLTVTIKELLECASFEGDVDKMSKHLFKLDWEEHLLDDTPLPTSVRSSRASGSPCKDGEDSVEKRAQAACKREKEKLFGQYVTWSNQVKAWLTKSKTPKSNNNSKTGETGKCGGPWEKSRARIAELEKDNKSLRAQVKQLKSTGANQSLTNSNATDVEPIKVEVQFWKQKV